MCNGHAIRLILACLIMCLFWHLPSRADDYEDRFKRNEERVTGDEKALSLELLSRIQQTLERLSRRNNDDSLNQVIAGYIQNIQDAWQNIDSSYLPERQDSSPLDALPLPELLERIRRNAGRNRITPSKDDREDRSLGRRLAAFSYHDTNPDNINRYAVLSVERSLRMRRSYEEISIETYASVFALILCFQPEMPNNTSQWLDDVNQMVTELTSYARTTQCKTRLSDTAGGFFCFIFRMMLTTLSEAGDHHHF